MEYEFDENGVVIAAKPKGGMEEGTNAQSNVENVSSEILDKNTDIQNNMDVENNQTVQPIAENNEGPEYKFDENGMIIGIVE